MEPSGTEPCSEQETCVLRDFILALRPAKLVSLHWALGEVEADGHHGNSLATAMWEAMSASERLPYRLRLYDPTKAGLEDFCPGSLGQWCGHDPSYEGMRPAMVTLELPYDPAIARPAILPADHLDTLRARWAADMPGYLAAVEPAVDAMLRAAAI